MDGHIPLDVRVAEEEWDTDNEYGGGSYEEWTERWGSHQSASQRKRRAQLREGFLTATEDIVRLRDAVERKLYDQEQTNTDSFARIANRVHDGAMDMRSFKITVTDSLSALSKAVTRLTERLDEFEMEDEDDMMDKNNLLRHENNELREENKKLRERLETTTRVRNPFDVFT